jgi:hypothetical protein
MKSLLTPRTHGVLTLLLLLLALLTGLVGIALVAVLPAVLYALIIAAGLPLVIYLFCGKCVCRGERCLMVYPGRLSMRLPDRRGEAYTTGDAAGIIGTLVLLAVFPLYWLWQATPLFVLFVVLALAAHAEVMLVVCRACENCRCPVNRWFRGKGLITGA